MGSNGDMVVQKGGVQKQEKDGQDHFFSPG
jgi:hypothetical protein